MTHYRSCNQFNASGLAFLKMTSTKKRILEHSSIVRQALLHEISLFDFISGLYVQGDNEKYVFYFGLWSKEVKVTGPTTIKLLCSTPGGNGDGYNHCRSSF